MSPSSTCWSMCAEKRYSSPSASMGETSAASRASSAREGERVQRRRAARAVLAPHLPGSGARRRPRAGRSVRGRPGRQPVDARVLHRHGIVATRRPGVAHRPKSARLARWSTRQVLGGSAAGAGAARACRARGEPLCGSCRARAPPAGGGAGAARGRARLGAARLLRPRPRPGPRAEVPRRDRARGRDGRADRRERAARSSTVLDGVARSSPSRYTRGGCAHAATTRRPRSRRRGRRAGLPVLPASSARAPPSRRSAATAPSGGPDRPVGSTSMASPPSECFSSTTSSRRAPRSAPVVTLSSPPVLER